MLANQMQVADVYGLARVLEIANKTGMRGGWGLVFTTHEEDGLPWGFNGVTMKGRDAREFMDGKSFMFIGSPTCRAYSAMNHTNYNKMAP